MQWLELIPGKPDPSSSVGGNWWTIVEVVNNGCFYNDAMCPRIMGPGCMLRSDQFNLHFQRILQRLDQVERVRYKICKALKLEVLDKDRLEQRDSISRSAKPHHICQQRKGKFGNSQKQRIRTPWRENQRNARNSGWRVGLEVREPEQGATLEGRKTLV